MYTFKDTTDHTQSTFLPSEAVQINGTYLENVIDGYRTLYVKGRETLSPEVEYGEVGVRDGSYMKSKRFPARVLTVGYQIVANSTAEFNSAFQKLNDYLNVEDAQIIFADETDKYLTGTPNGYEEIPAGQLSIKSEFEIVCADPFKYSITEYEVSPTLDDGATFVVDYNGTYPAYPVLQTDFYKSDTQGDTRGDCGFVAFSTQNADVLQFGTVAEPDAVNEIVQNLADSETTTWKESKCLINESFDALTGWTLNDGYLGSSLYTAKGTARSSVINGGYDKCFNVSAYGTTADKQWHGATVKKAIPSDGGNPATVGALNWKANFSLRYASSKTAKTAKAQAGMIRMAILDASGKSLVGITVFKRQGSATGKIQFDVNGSSAKTVTDIDLSYYNRYFGYRQKTTDKRPCNCDITKEGDKFTFNAGGITWSYRYPTFASSVAKYVSIYIAQWGAVPVTSWMGVYSAKFTSTSVTQTKTTETWEELTERVEIQNTFTTNDILVCDCSNGTVRLMNTNATDEINGGLHPELGALGNDWESFVLTKGVNQIGTMYSDWVTDAHKPTFTLRYRERYL